MVNGSSCFPSQPENPDQFPPSRSDPIINRKTWATTTSGVPITTINPYPLSIFQESIYGHYQLEQTVYQYGHPYKHERDRRVTEDFTDGTLSTDD